jgi:FkbM family methyltransferase
MREIEIVLKYFSHCPEKHENRIMFDVGAHVGSSALPFAKKGWEIYCFEPETSNYEELRENLKDYPKMHFIKMGVSDKNEENVPFFVSDEHWGIHTLKPFHPSHRESENISTTRLDTFISKNSIENIDFLKIDTEGADFLVLKSMDWDKDHPEVVVSEFMDSRTMPTYNYTFHDMVEYMANCGYTCYISEYGPIIEYGRKNMLTKSSEFKGIYPYHNEACPEWGNLLFCDESKLISFQKIIKKFQFNRKIEQAMRKIYIFQK